MPAPRPGSRVGGRRAERPLGGYTAKRDFGRTPEPLGRSAGATGGSARFVIQEHDARRLHWDLRLEHEGVLVCWALPKGLPETPGENRFAAATEDHPLEYLDFEGEIPRGQYGAGTVKIWDRGSYDRLKWEPRKIEVALHGSRIDARYALFAIEEGPEPKDWMIHRMDPPADPSLEPMPAHLRPMLARAGALPAEDGGWAYEIKWDGIRAIAYSRPGELRLESRNLNDITDRYPELARLGRALGSHSAILDGEIVAFDEEGKPSFSALQKRMHLSSGAQARRLSKLAPVTYVIFDLLWLDGHPLMDLPYLERRRRLMELQLSGPSWQTPEHVLGGGRELLLASAEQGLEGILAKRVDSRYQPGLRSRSWVKVKSVERQEFVIGGWMPGRGRRLGRIGALLIGVHVDGGGLRYVGRVGSGLSEEELDRLSEELRRLERKTSPFTAGGRPPKGAVFCKPRLVAEVEFAQWTEGGSLRAPRYVGLRDDKPAEQVTREPSPAATVPNGAAGISLAPTATGAVHATVQGRELKLTNLEKVLYPETGFTKRELILYYAAVAPVLLGHLDGRPLTVTRWPDGVEGKSFFQKQAPAHRPGWVATARLPSEKGPIEYTLAEDLPTLVWLANLAAIELHTPMARVGAIDRPTAVVFDLDPGEGAGILECCHVAIELEGMFAGLKLRSYAKTSGSKGLQVYLPLNNPAAGYGHTKPFAKAVAEVLERAEPDLVVSRMSKSRRKGRVLIDWSQNDARKTTICAYSLRAAERPTVSTPLDWEEVRAARDAGDPDLLSFEADEVTARVADQGDHFAPVLSLVQELPAL